MSQSSQPPALDWRDGAIPVARAFDDPYFSLNGGLDETRHVFLCGNGLPGRFRDGFQIAELGFGTGLNLLATVIGWQTAAIPGRFAFTSFEAFPMAPEDLARALSAFPALGDLAAQFAATWATGARRFALGPADVTIIEGDARDTLPAWPHRADAWFLDGFSPAKNPELWESALMEQVARHTAECGTFATYTAAGFVRRALAEAGFAVTRAPGFAGKRHMSTGVLA